MAERKYAQQVDQRRPLRQRWFTDMLCRNGRIEIAKLAEIAGYAIVVCVLWRHNEALVSNPASMALLLSVLVAPSVAKKALARFAGK